MILDITTQELNEIYEYILVLLGAEDVDVEITKKEIKVLARKALKDYEEALSNWWIQNNFSNVQGFDASSDFTRMFVSENGMIAQRISDWFSSLARVGGKTKWKKDWVTLRQGQQVYDLAFESSVPYRPGSRRIHRVMWYATPEIMGGQTDAAAIDGGLLTFGQAGLMYGANLMSYLGTSFDVVLLAQSLETRNKILRSEFFYNISGDKIELTPTPGGSMSGVSTGDKVFYYYFDEADFLGLDGQGPDGEPGVNELIGNPSQIQLDVMPYSKMNSTAKNWIENYTTILSKYMFASKLRAIRKIPSPDSDYQVEFDYQSLLQEVKDERDELFKKLQDLLDNLNQVKLMENKAAIMTSAATINKYSPRKLFIGALLPFLFLSNLLTQYL